MAKWLHRVCEARGYGFNPRHFFFLFFLSLWIRWLEKNFELATLKFLCVMEKNILNCAAEGKRGLNKHIDEIGKLNDTFLKGILSF